MASRARITKEALAISIVVRRRAKVGANPFGWEVHGADTAEPIHISPERFASMEAAYGAGQARLEEFIPKRRYSPEVAEYQRMMAREFEMEVSEAAE